jgi:RNA polymerase sigma-70 factor, ECF subfamily
MQLELLCRKIFNVIGYAPQSCGCECGLTLQPALFFEEGATLTSSDVAPPQSGNDQATDEALMLRYRAGDPDAFQALYFRYHTRLHRFVTRALAGRRNEADEVFQETWLAVIRGRGRYEPSSTFASYLFGIAHRRAADHWRRRYRELSARQAESGIMGIPEAVSPPADGMERLLSNAQLGAALLAAVGNLPEEQRTAFLLRAEGGLSLAEIAQVTGVMQETVKSRLRYALDKLRTALESWQ